MEERKLTVKQWTRLRQLLEKKHGSVQTYQELTGVDINDLSIRQASDLIVQLQGQLFDTTNG